MWSHFTHLESMKMCWIKFLLTEPQLRHLGRETVWEGDSARETDSTWWTKFCLGCLQMSPEMSPEIFFSIRTRTLESRHAFFPQFHITLLSIVEACIEHIAAFSKRARFPRGGLKKVSLNLIRGPSVLRIAIGNQNVKHFCTEGWAERMKQPRRFWWIK